MTILHKSGRRLVAGAVLGVATVLGLRLLINATPLADAMVAPLQVADTWGSGDAIVILGAGVVGDCEPNLYGIQRVLAGTRQFKAGRAGLVVITGGPAEARCAVADAMAALARETGVPGDRILVERDSTSTHENATFTARLLAGRDLRRVILVTDSLHMRRARAVFLAEGLEVETTSVPVYASHPDNVSMLAAGLRELAALGYYAMRGWLAPSRPAKGLDTADTRRVPLHDTGVLVILGASYAAGWTPGVVAGHAVLNKGVPGQESSELLSRFDSDVIAPRPRAVILWGFINDIFRSSDVERSLALARVNFSQMVERARHHHIEPILVTEVTIRPPKTLVSTIAGFAGGLLRRPSYHGWVNQHVVSMNAWLRELGRREGLLVLDFQRKLGVGDGPRRWAYAVSDGSHISAEGYRALNAYAGPLLIDRLSAERTAIP